MRLNQDLAWIDAHSRAWSISRERFFTPEQLRNNMLNTEVEIRTRDGTRTVTEAEAWLRSSGRRTYRDLVFRPGEGDEVDGCLNLWRGWTVPTVAGGITPWSELLAYIFNGDAKQIRWFEQWAAFPIQNPGSKLNVAVVFWSAAQGVGKSLIGQTLGKLYEPHFRVITAAELHGAFNGWARDVTFVLGEENSSGDHNIS